MSIQPQLVGYSSNTLREAFGEALAGLMAEFPNVVVLDGDVAGGTGTHHVRTKYPHRFYQIGIAEQNMMCIAAGMSQSGLLPVASTFAVFSLRGLEMIRLSIACDNRNVKIVCSHPGLDTGPDGASAQCLEDLGTFIALPNMTVVSPTDHIETALATRAIIEHVGPVYMRTGRSPAPRIFDNTHRFELGKGQIIRQGDNLTMVGCGVQVARCLAAAELLSNDGISARVVNMATLKPIDKDLLIQCAVDTGAILTSEDHNRLNGLGAQVARVLSEHYPVPIFCHGVNDTFGESGEPQELAEKYQLNPSYIAEHARQLLQRKAGR